MAHIIVETNFERPLADAEIKGGRAKLHPCIEQRH
jgi:hypothetical protein